MFLICLLFLSIPLRWIHLQHTRITRLFAREKSSTRLKMQIGNDPPIENFNVYLLKIKAISIKTVNVKQSERNH